MGCAAPGRPAELVVGAGASVLHADLPGSSVEAVLMAGWWTAWVSRGGRRTSAGGEFAMFSEMPLLVMSVRAAWTTR